MTAEDDVDDFIEQFTLAQGELLKGNPEPAKNLCSHRQDVTLANPLGPVVRGWEQVAAATDHAASQFRDGEIVDVEAATKCVTPELAYIVRVERSKAKVGTGGPHQHQSAGDYDHAPRGRRLEDRSPARRPDHDGSASRINRSAVAQQEMTRFASPLALA
jgi:hypothetical protein